MAIDIWYEDGRGLLFSGWYAANDDGPRRGPFATRREAEEAIDHARDDDCTVLDGTCSICGIRHASPCRDCGGRGFHIEGCGGA
jgi:hypothetical protein